MNQENKNEVVSSTTNQGQMLAGSPGIIIAPVNEQPVDASSPDKGKVNVSVEQVVPTTVSAPKNACRLCWTKTVPVNTTSTVCLCPKRKFSVVWTPEKNTSFARTCPRKAALPTTTRFTAT